MPNFVDLENLTLDLHLFIPSFCQCDLETIWISFLLWLFYKLIFLLCNELNASEMEPRC
jgi:hypothetical protein